MKDSVIFSSIYSKEEGSIVGWGEKNVSYSDRVIGKITCMAADVKKVMELTKLNILTSFCEVQN